MEHFRYTSLKFDHFKIFLFAFEANLHTCRDLTRLKCKQKMI